MGCLKDQAFDNGSIQSVRSQGTQKIIELRSNAEDTTNDVKIFFNSTTDKDTVVDLIPVNLASALPAPEDIHVTLQRNDFVIKNYNDSNHTNYGVAPGSIYSIINTDTIVTIPKGSNTGYLQIKLNPHDFIGQNLALGFNIKSVDKPGYIISGNLNRAIAFILIKNKIDGIYKVSGSFIDLSNAAFTANYPADVALVTEDLHSNAYFDININGGTFGHGFLNNGNGSYYGSFAPVFTIDDNGNVTSVVNLYGQPAGNGRSASLDPSGINKYDFDKKTLDVSYFMLQPAVHTPYRTQFVEHFEYVKPR